MKTIRIQSESFDVSAEIGALSDGRGDVGAIVTFSGHVRGDEGIRALRIEHYPGMTEREIARHIDEAKARWPLLGVTIIHRVGTLKAGEPIVPVVAASPHRAAAFAAAEFLMDYLKTRAPLWKEEMREGEGRWVEGKASDAACAQRWK